MNKFITVNTKFVSGNKQEEMEQRISELTDTYKVIGKKIDKEEINAIVEEYLVDVPLDLNISNISTLNPVPSKNRTTIRMNCGTELTIEESLDSFKRRMGTGE